MFKFPQTRVLTALDKMSPSVRSKLADILGNQKQFRVSPTDNDFKPHDDPGYSEFWIEVVPKPKADINDPIRTPVSERAFKGVTEFSEAAFGEVGPDFADMSPGDDDSSRKNNSIITMSAKHGGQVVSDPTFYRDILKSLKKPL